MERKTYENDEDYILEVLEEEEDNLTEFMRNNLPDNLKFQFSKFIAVRNAIEKIKEKNIFNKELYNKTV
ncbi:hypothetical protein LF65_02310 [Clostridium beijerinckii]|uniref:Uncharacterized protein n=1 Tax=Clostridium beijerinckii TaxID=1520 RepID=A0A0B5QKY8_CLOBE|nr:MULTISPECIES: hypothetical protein [Clostridium]AJG98896.1 hypothetical protein LF65_02310 [Clostridium beijerinckii]